MEILKIEGDSIYVASIYSNRLDKAKLLAYVCVLTNSAWHLLLYIQEKARSLTDTIVPLPLVKRLRRVTIFTILLAGRTIFKVKLCVCCEYVCMHMCLCLSVCLCLSMSVCMYICGSRYSFTHIITIPTKSTPAVKSHGQDLKKTVMKKKRGQPRPVQECCWSHYNW